MIRVTCGLGLKGVANFGIEKALSSYICKDMNPFILKSEFKGDEAICY